MKISHQVALTGGMGSGKTTVLHLFKKKGIPCYIADDNAKRLMTESENIVNAIKKEFGDNAYTNSHKLNIAFLASEVFKNKNKLEKLNHIVHPAVRKDYQDWVKQQNAPFVIYESALIFEHNQQDFFDEIVVVTAPEEERIKRVLKRSKMSQNDVKNRMNSQMDDNLKIKQADFVIVNLEKEDTIKETHDIYQKILNKIQNKTK